MLGDSLPEFDLVRSHVEKWHLALGERVGHAADDRVAELAFDVLDAIQLACAADLCVEGSRIGQSPRVDAECAQPNRAEILVADGDRLRRAPALIRLQSRGKEVDIALERRLKHLVPVHEVRQQWERVGVERVEARPRTSAIRPSLTKAAICDSRTVSFAPFWISMSCMGKRQASMPSSGSVQWMTSINCFLMKSRILIGLAQSLRVYAKIGGFVLPYV